MTKNSGSNKGQRGLKGWQKLLLVLLGAGLLISCTLLATQTFEDLRISSIIARNRRLASGDDGLVVLTPTPDPETLVQLARDATPSPAPTDSPTPEASVEASPSDSPETSGSPSLSPEVTPSVTPAPEPTPEETLIPDSTVTAAAAPLTGAGTVDLLALQRRNRDTVGWLSMDCVASIDFAVVQGRNAYYLNHDFDQHANSYGTPFLDEGSPLASQPDNYIIYAHNMRNGEMFGELNRVLETGRLVDYPFVHFHTIFGSQDFVPYAVVDLSVNQKSNRFMQYYLPNFTGPGQFIDYVYEAEHVSRVTLPWHAEYGDQLLTLVTCGKKSDERLVVFLRAVRDSERTAAD